MKGLNHAYWLDFRSFDGEKKCVLRLRTGCSLGQSKQMRLVGSLVHPSGQSFAIRSRLYAAPTSGL